MYDGGLATGSGVLLYGFVISSKQISKSDGRESMGGRQVAERGGDAGDLARLLVARSKAEIQPLAGCINMHMNIGWLRISGQGLRIPRMMTIVAREM